MSREQNVPPNSGQQAVQNYLDELLRPLEEDRPSVANALSEKKEPEKKQPEKQAPEKRDPERTVSDSRQSLAAKRLASKNLARKNQKSSPSSDPVEDQSHRQPLPAAAPKKVREPVDLSLLTLNLPRKLSFKNPPSTAVVEQSEQTEALDVKQKTETRVAADPIREASSEETVRQKAPAPDDHVSAREQELSPPSEDQTELNTRVPKPAPWADNGRPNWGQEEFECLLFDVAGLKLAVPLVLLGSIHRIDEDLTPLVGRADWFMGLFPQGERNIQVVDTARWVMPQKYKPSLRDGYNFAIRLGDTNWGLACDTVIRAFKLSPNEVKWRSANGARPWLAGTVIEHMCALLDVSSLAYQLDQAETSAVSPFS